MHSLGPLGLTDSPACGAGVVGGGVPRHRSGSRGVLQAGQAPLRAALAAGEVPRPGQEGLRLGGGPGPGGPAHSVGERSRLEDGCVNDARSALSSFCVILPAPGYQTG